MRFFRLEPGGTTIKIIIVTIVIIFFATIIMMVTMIIITIMIIFITNGCQHMISDNALLHAGTHWDGDVARQPGEEDD